jgi:outer membrane lipoprotein LolB
MNNVNFSQHGKKIPPLPFAKGALGRAPLFQRGLCSKTPFEKGGWRANAGGIFQCIFALLITLFLTHCATLPPPAQNQNLSWETRSKTLSQIQNWNLQGAIGVRTPQDSFSADLNWEQHQGNYTLSLYGPLGTNSFILTGQPNQVQLAMSDGRKFTAQDPEALVAQQLNWRLPVSNLYYWIRGLPVPGIPSHQSFDEFHHITELNQQGWKIQFLRYSSTKNTDLPTKLTLTYPQLNVKIVVSEWRV